MIGWFIGGGLVVGTFAWMSYSDGGRWVREAGRNLIVCVAAFGALAFAFWALQSWGYIR